MVLETFGDRAVFARVEAELHAGTMSYREIMEAEMATISAPLDEVNAFLLREARIRPGLHVLAERRRPVVLSSGFHETIEPLLARERVEADVVANRIDPRPDGWRIRWRDPEPCETCGDLCKRRSLPDPPFVYVGDGYSDRCAAQAAERVFARDDLARWLEEQGLPYEPFDDLHDVARAL
jgi:2-hydroxy-3-keto-5-methylthiopentenyl-1-phosphate phosphatase